MGKRRDGLTIGLLILAVAVWLGFEITRGMFTTSDELFTAERTREMLLLGRDQVHLNFQPSYSKPPLQYWLTSLTLPLAKSNSAWLSREVSVRVWPLIFGLFTAAVLVWLASFAESVNRDQRVGLALLAVAVLISCPLFTTEISRALLDSGLMFFTTFSVVFAQLARKQPRWWIAVAIVCWLGTLQKIPIVFLVWIVILLVRAFSSTDRQTLRTWWLPLSFLLAVAFSSIWPAVQFCKHHAELSEVLGLDEMANRIRNVADRSYLEIPLRMNVLWVGGGALALAAPIFFLVRKDRLSIVKELSILCLAITVLAILFNFRSVRYLTPIIPCFCLLIAFLLQWLLDKEHPIRTITGVLALIFFGVGIGEAEVMMNLRRQDVSDQKGLAEQLSSFQSQGIEYVLIRNQNHQRLQFAPFFLFYGDLRSPVLGKTIEEFIEKPAPNVVAISSCKDFATISERFPGVLLQKQIGEFVCWRLDRE